MRQSLQQKFNLLTVVLLFFFFLMLPIFSQVKADTRDSVKHWRDTLSYKVWKDVKANWINKDKLNNIDIEEVNPDDWSRQAKEADPSCDAACQPDGDRDGDNMTNAEELKQGRNPSCNEDKFGADYCKRASKTDPPVEPPKNATKKVVTKIAEFNLTIGTSDCNQLGSGCSSNLVIDRNYTELRFYLNLTGFQGLNWNYQAVQNPGAGPPQWSVNPYPSGGPSAQPGGMTPFTAIEDEPQQGTYRFTLGYTGAQSGQYHMKLYGVSVT